jgi:hypothetical protein
MELDDDEDDDEDEEEDATTVIRLRLRDVTATSCWTGNVMMIESKGKNPARRSLSQFDILFMGWTCVGVKQ